MIVERKEITYRFLVVEYEHLNARLLINEPLNFFDKIV